jgi:hypothetical protein
MMLTHIIAWLGELSQSRIAKPPDHRGMASCLIIEGLNKIVMDCMALDALHREREPN